MLSLQISGFDEEIAASGGSTYGIITNLININKRQFPWLKRNMVNYFRTKATQELKLPPEEIGDNHESAISGITSCSEQRVSEELRLNFDESENANHSNIEDSGNISSQSKRADQQVLHLPKERVVNGASYRH